MTLPQVSPLRPPHSLVSKPGSSQERRGSGVELGPQKRVSSSSNRTWCSGWAGTTTPQATIPDGFSPLIQRSPRLRPGSPTPIRSKGRGRRGGQRKQGETSLTQGYLWYHRTPRLLPVLDPDRSTPTPSSNRNASDETIPQPSEGIPTF